MTWLLISAFVLVVVLVLWLGYQMGLWPLFTSKQYAKAVARQALTALYAARERWPDGPPFRWYFVWLKTRRYFGGDEREAERCLREWYESQTQAPLQSGGPNFGWLVFEQVMRERMRMGYQMTPEVIQDISDAVHSVIPLTPKQVPGQPRT